MEENHKQFRKIKRNKWISRLLACVLAVLMTAGIMLLFEWMFPGLLSLVCSRDQKAIEAYLAEAGQWKGLLCLFFLSAVQVISIVLPGVPIHVTGGLLYGWWKGTLVCCCGFVFGSVLVFLLDRRVGKRLHRFFPAEERSEETAMQNRLIEQMKKQNPSVAVGLAVMIPGVPRGLIPHAAAGTGISAQGFAGAVTATAWMQILRNCLVGDFLIRGMIFQAGLVYVLYFLLIALVTWKRQEILGRFR